MSIVSLFPKVKNIPPIISVGICNFGKQKKKKLVTVDRIIKKIFTLPHFINITILIIVNEGIINIL